MYVVYAFKNIGAMKTQNDKEFKYEVLKACLVNFCFVLFVVLGKNFIFNRTDKIISQK